MDDGVDDYTTFREKSKKVTPCTVPRTVVFDIAKWIESLTDLLHELAIDHLEILVSESSLGTSIQFFFLELFHPRLVC